MALSKADAAPTKFADLSSRKIAYRMFGSGTPLVLAVRFRGTLDAWDPLFLDELAKSFTVVIFDYTGLGASSGEPTYLRESLAQDAKDLIDYLGFGKVVIGGWSLGGVVAQVVAAKFPEAVSHAVLIGTAPPGTPEVPGDPLFMRTAMKPQNDLEDEFILFFEPQSGRSTAAAARSHDRLANRKRDRSPTIPESTFMKLLSEAKDRSTIFPDPEGAYMSALATSEIPILVVSGDHDIACPVENWYGLSRKWQSMHLLTTPQSGHAPHHQEPEFVARAIAAFVASH
ncbi:alpha/beta hydrolase [Rhizobium sp. CNPSo 4039]|uniref:alpha/beta fold hydrolase n=1 Tax=Rhizobium sp. CNPSo 4039 TaxID=3021409 RepID=UPI00254F1D27|nr:alpha/beta hydrolase [Rhizobium sp. CNPSo 4039]MDK4716029.1 alpha/beta hydrolase [Rhizobium sp. CNPSo 4039]